MWLFNLFLPCLVFNFCNVVSATQEEPPKVTLTDGGIVVGSCMNTVNGKKFRAFQGIPYAESPTGELRFKPPVPIKPWSGEKLCNKDGNECFSQNPFMRSTENAGEEDCLKLNVYTPEIKENKNLYPVMVYIHGGGFISGSCRSEIYGPKRLLDHGVVYVCGNYRLGAFGFLSTYTEDCPGNNGLKDQNLYLKWVQKNIEKFGGNPNDVTIFGESAGAASVGYHLYSSQSRGLFKKAILQSATNFDPWPLGNKALVLETTTNLAKVLDCPVNENSWKESINCLRTKSGEQILETYKDLLKYDFEPSVLFPPVIEPEQEGAFVTRDPRKFDTSPAADIPIIIGMTSDDGSFKSAAIINHIKEDFDKKMYEVLPIFLYYNSKPKEIQTKITKQLDEFYFQGKHDWSPENHQNLTNLFTDGYFTCGQDQFLRQRFASADRTTVAPTFVYIFDHRNPESLSTAFGGGPHYYGVCHGDELGYIFSGSVFKAEGDSYDERMKLAMLTMWTAFAKTGNPTPEGSYLPRWTPANKFPLNYAHIGSKTRENWKVLTNEVGLWEDRVRLWQSFEKIH